jgi:ribosomal protein L21E
VFSSRVQGDIESVTSYGAYVDKLRENLQQAHALARRHLRRAAERSKEIYDARAMINKYKEGDLVWILHESTRAGSAPKLERNYKGPFIVTSCLSDVTFVIQMDQNGYKRVVNHDKLKPYEGEKPPNWTVKLQKKLKKD